METAGFEGAGSTPGLTHLLKALPQVTLVLRVAELQNVLPQQVLEKRDQHIEPVDESQRRRLRLRKPTEGTRPSLPSSPSLKTARTQPACETEHGIKKRYLYAAPNNPAWKKSFKPRSLFIREKMALPGLFAGFRAYLKSVNSTDEGIRLDFKKCLQISLQKYKIHFNRQLSIDSFCFRSVQGAMYIRGHVYKSVSRIYGEFSRGHHKGAMLCLARTQGDRQRE